MTKKILSLLIALSMLLSVAVSASTVAGNGSASGVNGGGIAGSGNSGTSSAPSTGTTSALTMSEPAVSRVNGNAYQVGVDIENLTEDAILRIALYKGNQLTGFINRTVCADTAASGTVAAAPTTFQLNAAESDKAKVFLFDKASPLSVLCSGEKDLTEALDLMLTLSGASISGGTYKNVTVSSAVGDGEVYLNNVEIEGDLNIYGGGSNSIHLSDCLVEGTVKMASELPQSPRLALTNTNIEKIIVSKMAVVESVDTESAIKNIEAAANIEVRGANTSVDKISISSEDKVMINGFGKIKEVVAKSNAMIMPETSIEKVVIPETAIENIAIEVMGEQPIEVVVNTSNGVSIGNAANSNINVTVSTDLETAPTGVSVGGNTVSHFHKWDDGTVTKEPTTSSEGTKTYSCTDSACTETKTESIPKLPKPQNPGYYFSQNENGLYVNWPAYSLANNEYYYVNATNYWGALSVTGTKLSLSPFVATKTENMELSIKVSRGTSSTSLTEIYSEYEIADVTVSGNTPDYTIEKQTDGKVKLNFANYDGVIIYAVYDNNDNLTNISSTANGIIENVNISDGYTVSAQLMTWTLNADNTYANINITMPKSLTYHEPSSEDKAEISLVQSGKEIYAVWTGVNCDNGYTWALIEDGDIHQLDFVGKNVSSSTDFKPCLTRIDSGVHSYDFVLYEYDESAEDCIGKELGRLDNAVEVTITGESVGYAMSFTSPADGQYQITLDYVPSAGDTYLTRWNRGRSNYSGIYVSNGTQTYTETTFMRALQSGDIYDLRLLTTYTLEGQTIKAVMTPPSTTNYEKTTILFRKWKTDIMFDGYDDVDDTKSLEVNGIKVVSGKAETMSEFLFDYDQTKGNIIDADFVVELDSVEKDRICGNVDVTISNDEVPFSVNSDGTLSFDETANGCYAYKTTKGGAGRIAFTNGTLVDGWELPTLSIGETIDIMHIDCTYDETTKAISATLSKHTTKTYTLASDGNIWFSETDYGYPCVQWTPAELSDDEFYVCNDMEWFDTTGYLYFELLNIEESGYIPITISRGTWDNKTPLYTNNEAAHTTITDTEQNLSLVEESDGRYKITSHLNNFDAKCFVYQVRSKTGTPLLTNFTTGKIYVSPHDNIEVFVRQVKWNISSDKKQIEYTITPLYKITTYADTQTQTEETYVSTYDEMKAALNKGGLVKLSANIQTTSMLTLNTGDAAILDLNGHTLDIPRIEARNGKSLTINQTTSGSSLINSNGTQEVSVYYGDLTLNGGTYAKISAQWANSITLNGIVGSYNDYSFYHGTNVSITDCTFGSDENASRINIQGAEKATITDTVVYGDSYSISFSSVNKAVVENTTITASNDAISCQTNTNLELNNVNATAESETIRVHADCNVTIDGGEYEVTTSYSNLIYMIGGPTVTIKGGKFAGGKTLANPSAINTGTLNISGGDFTYYTNALLGKAMTCNISGGSFGYDVSEYIDDDCTCTNNSDGTYTVSEKPATTITDLRIAPYVSTIYSLQWNGKAPTGPNGNYYKVYGTSDSGTTWQLIEYAYHETKYPLSSQSATNYNGIKVEYIKDGAVAETITDLTFNIKSEVIASSTVPAATFTEPDANGQSAVSVTGLTPNTYFRFVVDGKVAGISTKSFVSTSSTSGGAERTLSLSPAEIQNGIYTVYEFINPTLSDDGKNFSYAAAESAWQSIAN